MLLNGIAFSALLFLLASGLTLILGLARIINFAHGAFFILGAYLAITIANATNNWWIALPIVTICLAIIGGGIEFLLLRRIYGKELLLQLVVTFGIVLIIEDLIKIIWTSLPYGLTMAIEPPFLSGSIFFMGITFPKNSIGIIIMSSLICLLLWLLLNKTKLGKQINAASSDMDMVDALGINVSLLFTFVFILGSALAGIAGVFLSLRVSLVPSLGFDYLIYAFAVVVIGGLGSYRGSIYASLIVGILYSLGILLISDFAMVFIFALLLLTLLIRPMGLFGVVEEIRAPAVAIGKKLKLEFFFFRGKFSSKILVWVAGIALICFVILLPSIVSPFWVVLTTEAMILILLALSMNMLITTGLLSLGHGAFFGASAYAVSLIIIHFTNSMLLALLVSILTSSILAFVIGSLSLRHIEIYFSLLTLSFAQLIYTIVWKWTRVTGGDDGLMGIPLPSFKFFGLSSSVFTPDTTAKYMYFVLVITGLAIVTLLMVLRSPFGQILQALRENTERVSFLGLNPRRYKLAAFILAGSFAGLAGAVMAPFQMTISPIAAHWTKSIEPIFMCVVGGINTLIGPGVGAIFFIFFRDWLSSQMEYWRIFFGIILIIIAIAFPRGLVGYLQIAFSNILSREHSK